MSCRVVRCAPHDPTIDLLHSDRSMDPTLAISTSVLVWCLVHGLVPRFIKKGNARGDPNNVFWEVTGMRLLVLYCSLLASESFAPLHENLWSMCLHKAATFYASSVIVSLLPSFLIHIHPQRVCLRISNFWLLAHAHTPHSCQ